MAHDIHSIVQELIELDPSLEPHRASLEENITLILAAKPDTKFSEEFKEQLYRDLKLRFSTHTSSHSQFSLSAMIHNALIGVGGAVVGAIAVFAVSQQSLPLPTGVDSDVPVLEEGVTSLGSQAFGDLSTATAPAGRGGGGAQGGGGVAMGGSPAIDSAMPVPGADVPEMIVENDTSAKVSEEEADRMMIDPGIMPYNPVRVDYLYDGEIPLPEGQVTVLRRKPVNIAADGSSLLRSFGNKADWSTFGKLNVRYVNLSQDGDEPLAVNLDFQNGTLDISRMIDYSARPESQCRDEACFQRYRLSIDDVPADDQLIAAANAFLQRHGISTEGYGEPFVSQEWRMWYDLAENKDEYYIPEGMQVVYPMLIDGKPVYEEYGNQTGLFVSVDIRDNVVTSVYGMMSRNFESSAYAGASDEAQVREVLKKGGVNAWVDPSAERSVQAALGAPTEAFVRMYQWNERTSVGQDLFVPALVFPVTEQPSEGERRMNIVVPLAEDLLKSNQPPVHLMME